MKLIFINFSIILLSIFFILFGYLYDDYSNRIIYVDSKELPITYIMDEVEVYSKVKISDFIKLENLELIDNDIDIDTSKVGNKNIEFLFLDGKRLKKSTFDINIIDSEAPYIDLGSSYTVYLNTDVDLLKSIMCIDNYDNKVNSYIEGEYDLNTVGDYNLKYVAVDSSNNINSKDFKLIVKEKSKNTSSNSDISYYFSDAYQKYKNNNTMIGIDISKWQGDIDFSKIKASNVEFVMIRIGSQNGIHGESVLDKYFEGNIKGAIENNIDVGIYYYSYASNISEALEQAKFIEKELMPYKEYIKFPIAFDFECFKLLNSFNLSMYSLNKIADTFMNTLEGSGYSTMLYGSRNYLENVWKYTDKNIWLAHYTDETNYKGNYKMWQFSNIGRVDGIDGHVDMDVYYMEV